MRREGAVSTAEALQLDLERRILEGELEPGRHLREIELSEHYGVGRHTLRAAFDALVRHELLARERNRGVFVRVLTAVDLTEIYELRAAIETQAFRTLALQRARPPEAEQAIASLREIGSRSPSRAAIDADLAFHSAMVVAAGNARLARVHQDLDSEIRLCLAQLVRGYASAGQIAAEHTALLDEVGNGRVQGAERAVRDHLDRALAWLVERASTA
jgi:DNA-binding GntR family transcriptional regulator